MDMGEAIRILKEQIGKIEELQQAPSYGPEFQIWNNTTGKILQEAFSPDYVSMFKGAGGGLRVVMNAQERHRGYIRTLEEKKRMLEGIIKEHERFAGTGTAVIAGSRPIGTYRLHPEIAKVSGKLLDDGHFAQAVEEAFKRTINEVKAHMIKRGGEIYDGGDSLMNHAFGCDNRVPPIKFNALNTQEERDEQKGMMFLFKGIVAIRNRKAHDNVTLNSPERAVEYLGLASLLMRLLDFST
jgi:uncharacterized protein (TIGR02391 family)